MYMKDINSVGELRYLLAGIPDNIPLRLLTSDGEKTEFRAGYGTDPRDLTNHIVVINAIAGSSKP